MSKRELILCFIPLLIWMLQQSTGLSQEDFCIFFFMFAAVQRRLKDDFPLFYRAVGFVFFIYVCGYTSVSDCSTKFLKMDIIRFRYFKFIKVIFHIFAFSNISFFHTYDGFEKFGGGGRRWFPQPQNVWITTSLSPVSSAIPFRTFPWLPPPGCLAF